MDKWEDFEKTLNITTEEEEEIQLEMNIIRATIEARKNAKLSQEELSKKTGIKQPSIARIEKGTHSPTANTLIKILYPMGYTIEVVPLKNKRHKLNQDKYKNLDF